MNRSTTRRTKLSQHGVISMTIVVTSMMLVACGVADVDKRSGHSTSTFIGEGPYVAMALNQDTRDFLTAITSERDLAARGVIVSIGPRRWNTANGWMPNPFRDRSTEDPRVNVTGRTRIVDIEVTEMIKSSSSTEDCEYLTMVFFTNLFVSEEIGELGNEVLVVGDRYTHVFEPSLSMGDVHMFDLMKQKIELSGHNFCSVIPELYWRKSGNFFKDVNEEPMGGYTDIIESARATVSKSPQESTLSVPFLLPVQPDP